MISCCSRRFLSCLFSVVLQAGAVLAQTQAQSTPSSSSKHVKKHAAPPDSSVDAGAIADSVYRNKSFALSCKIPPGWVLRTDELNAREKEIEEKAEKNDLPPAQAPTAAADTGAKVLLAAFSRPPGAKGEEINSSILIAVESASSYPGLKEAAQYFFPLTEVAKAQGFTPDEDPYEFAVGTKTLVRGDFHKDVGSRVMHQSTLAMLSHGYAVSITVIAGTEDGLEELIDGLSFSAPPPGVHK